MSYNQPKLSSCVQWNPTAINFANNTILGHEPFGMYVSSNNTVYAASRDLHHIVVWSERNSASPKIIHNITNAHSLFVTIHDGIYIDNGEVNHRVDQWNFNITNDIAVMNLTMQCIGLFVDFTNTLYCSIDVYSIVLKLPLGYGPDMGKRAAGSGNCGSASNLLCKPNGIFVDIKRNLYVADSGNHRIQLFRPGDTNGITVAGNTLTGFGGLKFPTGVVLDADGYLYIADHDNGRIIRAEPKGFRCIIGCSDQVVNDRPLNPQVLWFDSHGNLFVLDNLKDRIQKFLLSANSSGKLMMNKY